jgi:hypothetical protein
MKIADAVIVSEAVHRSQDIMLAATDFRDSNVSVLKQ